MTEIEKVAAIMKADMPDTLKLELIQKIVGPAEYPPPVIVYPTVTPAPVVPNPWEPWPGTTWCGPDGIAFEQRTYTTSRLQ